MKTPLRTVAVMALVAGGVVAAGTSRAHAQAFGFSYAQPGFGLSVGTGPYGVAAFPGYPAVVPAPVVAAAPVVVPPPLVVARPLVVPGPYYGAYYRGGYRPYPYPYRYYRR
jgi:hypothetical protein